MSGLFIVFEGPDGAGTTTHSELLAETLRMEGRDVLLTTEPTDGPIGLGIRQLLKEGGVNGAALQLLFTADRADHVEKIEHALNKGNIVICDRYIPSTIAYGSALGLDVRWLKEINEPFRKADCTLLLLPPRAVCEERMARRNFTDALEHEALRGHVYDAYERLAEGDPNIRVVDTSESIFETAKEIRNMLPS